MRDILPSQSQKQHSEEVLTHPEGLYLLPHLKQEYYCEPELRESEHHLDMCQNCPWMIVQSILEAIGELSHVYISGK